MESPDIELEVGRDDGGFITGVRYKLNKVDEDRKNVAEFLGLASDLFHSERVIGAEFYINADVNTRSRS